MDGMTGAALVGFAHDYLTSDGVAGATVTVDPPEPSSAGYREAVTVTVGLPFDQVNWLSSPMLIGGETTLTAATVTQQETIQYVG